VLEDPRIAAATLTGSEAAGSQVAAAAGRAIKKVVLELGGSDPFIVMPSADLPAAVATGVQARLVNNGQSCIAAKRFLVAEPVAEEFERRFVAAMKAVRVGDPMDEATEVGPLASAEMLATLDDQVRRSAAAGARILTGGRRLYGPGCYYAPRCWLTSRSRPRPTRKRYSVPWRRSTGARRGGCHPPRQRHPVRPGASVWTNDSAERERFIEEIEAGMVFVNEMVVSDPRLPFGGVKRSGYGGSWASRESASLSTSRPSGSTSLCRPR